MLCCSPSYTLDTMERASAFLNSPTDIMFSKLNLASEFVKESMTSCFNLTLDDLSTIEQLATSSPFVNSSDFMEHINDPEYMSAVNLNLIEEALECVSTDTSTTTSPSISPRSDSSEEVRSEAKIVYWNKNILDSIYESVTANISSCPSLDSSNSAENNGLLCAASSIDNSGLYTLANNSNTTDMSEGYIDIDSIKIEPLGDDPEARMALWDDVIADMPNADPIISSCHSLDSSKSVVTQANNGLLCTATSSLDTGLCSLANNSPNMDNSPEIYFNLDSIKKEPIDDDQVDISGIACMCGLDKPDCDCSMNIVDLANTDILGFDLMSSLDAYEDNDMPLMNDKDLSKVLIRPECGDFTLNNLPTSSKPSNFDLNIPCSSSAIMEIYSDGDDYNNSFDNLEETKLVNVSDVCPLLGRNRVAEPPASCVLNSHNSEAQKVLTPFDKVKNDHCYTKSEIFDEPAPLQAAMNYNFFLEGLNEIPIPVKRRPGRPRKCTTSVPVEKQVKVTSQRAPQKRTKKAIQTPAKRMKLQLGSAADCHKRMLHNQAERDRRLALRDSMFSVARQCPDHVLNLTEVALQSTKAKRSEEVENNFTVDVLRKVDELVKRVDYDRRLLKSKKSPTYSKMVMLLGITYFISNLEKDLKSKENILSRNESFLRSQSSKHYRRIKKG